MLRGLSRLPPLYSPPTNANANIFSAQWNSTAIFYYFVLLIFHRCWWFFAGHETNRKCRFPTWYCKGILGIQCVHFFTSTLREEISRNLFLRFWVSILQKTSRISQPRNSILFRSEWLYFIMTLKAIVRNTLWKIVQPRNSIPRNFRNCLHCEIHKFLSLNHEISSYEHFFP